MLKIFVWHHTFIWSNADLVIRYRKNFWGFTRLILDLGPILLISNIVIHRSFTGPTHLLSANVRGPVSLKCLAVSEPLLEPIQCMTAIWDILIWKSIARLNLWWPYISMILKKLKNFNSHVGDRILRSHSPEEIFTALAIGLLLQSNTGNLSNQVKHIWGAYAGHIIDNSELTYPEAQLDRLWQWMSRCGRLSGFLSFYVFLMIQTWCLHWSDCVIASHQLVMGSFGTKPSFLGRYPLSGKILIFPSLCFRCDNKKRLLQVWLLNTQIFFRLLSSAHMQANPENNKICTFIFF